MLPALNDLQPRIRTPHKQLNLSLGVCNRVNGILSTMQPKHRTDDIRKSSVQPVSIPKVDGSHASTLPSLLANIVGRNLVAPEVADVLRAIFAEADVDEEIGEIVAWREVGDGGVGGPVVDGYC